MAFAALGVALVALAVAGASAYWARRLATAEEIIAQAAIDRRHDETTPRVSATVSDRTRVTIVNNGPQDLDDLAFSIVDGGIVGLRIGNDTMASGSIGALAVGSGKTFEAIETTFETGGLARLRFTCQAGTERWVVGGYFEIEPVEAPTSDEDEPPTREGGLRRLWWDESSPSTAESDPVTPVRMKVGITYPARIDRAAFLTPQLG